MGTVHELDHSADCASHWAGRGCDCNTGLAIDEYEVLQSGARNLSRVAKCLLDDMEDKSCDICGLSPGEHKTWCSFSRLKEALADMSKEAE